MTETIAYKILTAEQFAALRNDAFEGSPIDILDGFIHLSTAAQLTDTVRKHFSGQTGLTILAIALDQLSSLVRWEVSRDNQLFPHIYGRLRMADVQAHTPLRWKGNAVLLPE